MGPNFLCTKPVKMPLMTHPTPTFESFALLFSFIFFVIYASNIKIEINFETHLLSVIKNPVLEVLAVCEVCALIYFSA